MINEWRIPDSNRPPSDCEPDALPDELNPRFVLLGKTTKKILLYDINIAFIFILLRVK